MRKHFRFKRLVLGLAFGFAVAAFSVPTVQAKPTSSGNGPLDPWAYGLVHGRSQAYGVPAAKYGPLDPWAYAVIHRSASRTSVPPDVRDHRLIAELVQSDRPTSQTAFNWGDAGIGASVSFGLVFLVLLALTLSRRYRQRPDQPGIATS